MDRPVPAFYCVYMLRSTVARCSRSLYIGSTPNPRRRLRQHNGEIQGGAARTADRARRPWEMAVIVSGFPSKIAALQFEWSLHNTHLTRHVHGADKDSLSVGRRRPVATLNRKLQDLHMLLRASSFARWPLRVQFFAEDAYRHWQSKTTKQFPFEIPPYTQVTFEPPSHNACLPDAASVEGSTKDKSSDRTQKAVGASAIDAIYDPMLPRVQKTSKLLQGRKHVECAVCYVDMSVDRDLFAVCTAPDCTMMAHLTCLNDSFRHGHTGAGPIVPVHGTCPSCHAKLSWSDLARETSLRARGKDILDKMLRHSGAARAKKGSSSSLAADSLSTSAAAEAMTATKNPLDDEDEDGDNVETESEVGQDVAIAGLVVDAHVELLEPATNKPRNKAAKTVIVVPDSDNDSNDNDEIL